MPELSLRWGIDGVEDALANGDNVVIVDVLRFSSAVVAATARGFTIEPSADKYRKKESGARLSPGYYENRVPGRVQIYSSNGAFLSIAAAVAENVFVGSLLNAKAVARHVDGLRHSASLIAAGEIDRERLPMMGDYETDMAEGNRIFCMEDMLGAGAVARFSRMAKSSECVQAERLFRLFEAKLGAALEQSATGRFNESRGNGGDTQLCSELNRYDVVPSVRVADGVVEISAARITGKR
ncbi:MAG: 2-phosphosulfolactate phosphatase [Candidatus Marsarchaeota archaeon]|nr:2-phosphosulfolactate phosphatase [Candidatus Marsarchaeota archaeon]